MKKLLLLIPYSLTNIGTMVFCSIGLLLMKDSYYHPEFHYPLNLFFSLSFVLLIFSSWKYLVRSTVPDVFNKGSKQGFWHIIKYLTAILCFNLIVFYKDPADLAFLYSGALWLTFSFALYCHFFWGRRLKKQQL
jgi:hypothetical protein